MDDQKLPLPPPAKPRSPATAMAALALLLAAGAAGLSAYHWHRASALENRLTALESTNDTSSENAHAASPENNNREQIAAALASLNERVEKLETAPSTQPNRGIDAGSLAQKAAERAAQNAETLAALQTELATLQSTFAAQKSGLGAQAAALQESMARFIAWQKLASALNAGRPYANELKAVTASPAQDLLAASETGLPTAAALLLDFRALRPSLLAADARANAQDIWGRIKADLSSLIIIRPENPAPDAVGLPDRLGRIETALETQNLAAAQGEIAALPTDTRALLAALSQNIARRQAAEAALNALSPQTATPATNDPSLPSPEPVPSVPAPSIPTPASDAGHPEGR